MSGSRAFGVSPAQAADPDLTAIAGLSPSNDDLLQRKAGAWTNRTPAQVKIDLALNNVDNTSDANKPVSTAQATADGLRVLKAGDTMTGLLTLASGGAGVGGLAIGADTVLYRQGTDQIRTEDLFSIQRASGSDSAMASKIPADSAFRYQFTINGAMSWGPGNAGVDTNLYRNGTDLLATDDDFAISVAGKGLRVKEGSNAKMGVATLVAGTVTVATTAVTASSRIFLSVQSLGTVAAPKAVAVTARTAATSFVITSEDTTDTSVVAWHLIEPA